MAALRDAAGWAASGLDRLDLAGPDRVRFLHNLVTCEIRELAPGRSVRGFFTHVKGGVLADVEIVALADRIRLLLPAGRGPALRAHLERYRIVERVEIEDRPDLVALDLRGARTPGLLAALGLPAPEPGERVEASLGGAAVAVRRDSRDREPRFELETSAADREAMLAAVAREGAGAGGSPLSDAALDCARIEDGELHWGVDYGEENFPQELGDEAAVSYTKGCYLGQEVVARIHYRGGVQRLPRRVRFAPDARLERGAELLLEGRPVGRATSLAREPENGDLVGLSLVHRRAAEGGTWLELADGGRGRIEGTAG